MFSSKQLLISILVLFFSRQIVIAQRNDTCSTDITNYAFNITISDQSDTIKAEATITAKLLHAEKTLSFDFEGPLPNGKGMSVTRVESENIDLIFSQINRKLVISSQTMFTVGSECKFKITYKGIPSDGLIISKNKYGQRTFFADNWPQRARCWIPCNDFQSDKATVNFTILAPSHYQVVANGELKEQVKIPGNYTKWIWTEKVPISTKVMVFGAADFAIQQAITKNNIPVSAWVYNQNKEEGFLDYSPAGDILDTFIHIIGEYPYEKLANVQSTTIYGGMENASCIFYAEASVTGQGRAESLLAHEIAHQWFGNSVTESGWSDLWLSEGFATFFANIYIERKYGKDSLRHRLITERMNALYWRQALSSSIIPEKISDPRVLLNPNTYEKAGWVLHMLRMELGDSVFFLGIQSYFRKFENITANTRDFEEIMESISGRDLKGFFTQWLSWVGYPRINVKWQYLPDKAEIQFQISQDQAKLYSLPLEIQIDNSKNIFRTVLIERNYSFSMKTSKIPRSITLDPNIKLFAKFSVSKL